MKPDNDGKECLSEKQLLSYINNELSPAEKRQVELHLTDCELCSDALEGIRLLKNKEHATELVAEIKHNINKKLEGKVRPLILQNQWIQVAAIFFIIAIATGGYIYISQFSSEKVAMEKPVEKKVQTRPLEVKSNSDGKIAEPTPQDNSNTIEKTARESQPSQTKNLSTESVTQNSANEVHKEGYSDNTLVTTAPLFNETKSVEEKKVTLDDSHKDLTKEDVTTKSADTRFESQRTTNAPAAQPHIQESEAVVAQSKAKKHVENIEEIKNIYMNAESLFNKKEYNEALKLFDIVVARSTRGRMDYYYDALWYSAEIAIIQKRKADAKSLLEQLKNESKKYKKQATARLTELN